MPVPESTSAEAFDRYVGGTCLRTGRGPAWREIKASIVAPPRKSDALPLPAVSETYLAWTISGDAEFEEREGDGPWVGSRLRPGSFFLTSGGASYDCRWRALSPEPFQSMNVFIGLPLLQRALTEVHGAEAEQVRLRDVSAFTDPTLHGYMEQLRGELLRKRASPLLVQGLGQAIAVHLARHYAGRITEPASPSPALPGFKLRQINDWLAAHLAEEFSLDRLAALAGVSKFHFIRLFKRATGVSPSRYHLNLRMNAAKQLLRESRRSIVDICLDVGFANPSHFARIFRRETGLSPSDYRRRR